MRKVELVARIAAATDVTNTQAEAAVETILTTIKEALQRGESVSLRGVGTFAVRTKRARMGRNPRTGAAAEIPARRVVAFKAGKLFKQAVAGVAPPAAAPAPPTGAHGPRRAAPRAAQAPPSPPERSSSRRPPPDVPASATSPRRRPRTRGEGGHHADR
jgi:DNA-binding protein HU-beta